MIVHGTARTRAVTSGDMNGKRRGTAKPRQASSSAKAGTRTTPRTTRLESPTPSKTPWTCSPAMMAAMTTVTAHANGTAMTRYQRTLSGSVVSVRPSRPNAPRPSTRASPSAMKSGPRARTNGATSVGIAGRKASAARSRQTAMNTATEMRPRRLSGETSGSCATAGGSASGVAVIGARVLLGRPFCADRGRLHRVARELTASPPRARPSSPEGAPVVLLRDRRTNAAGVMSVSPGGPA